MRRLNVKLLSPLHTGSNHRKCDILVHDSRLEVLSFLVYVIGWTGTDIGRSAFVGMGVMILLFPLPGYVAKLIQTAQVATMKTVSIHIGAIVLVF